MSVIANSVSEEFQYYNCPCRWQLRFEPAITFCSFAQKSYSGSTSFPSHGLEVDGNGIFSISYGSYWPVLLFDALSIRVEKFFVTSQRNRITIYERCRTGACDFCKLEFRKWHWARAVSHCFYFAILSVLIIKIYAKERQRKANVVVLLFYITDGDDKVPGNFYMNTSDGLIPKGRQEPNRKRWLHSVAEICAPLLSAPFAYIK